MRTLIAAALLAVAPAVAAGPRPKGTATPIAHFAILLEHSAQGWAATCDTGCRWTHLTMSCEGCKIRVDVAGVGPASAPERGTEGFSFTLRDAGAGWQATRVRGTIWGALAYGCATTVCRARIDEAGVAGLAGN